jgi:alpha-glucosidase (family GH31 glycosyl hydrolase)
LYLEYPGLDESYKHSDEYFFGKEFLCAPIIDSTGERDVYLPPGTWFDYFTDKALEGNTTIHTRHSLATFPLFVRNGSIIPTRPNLQYSEQHPLDSLVLSVYGEAPARFNLYDDDAISLDYQSGAGAWTALTSKRSNEGSQEITIAPTKGSFKGQVRSRAYTIILHGFKSPKSVAVNGKRVPEGVKGYPSWSRSSEKSLVMIHLPSQDIRNRTTVVIR